MKLQPETHASICVCVWENPEVTSIHAKKEAEATKTVSVSADFNMGNSVKDIFFIV